MSEQSEIKPDTTDTAEKQSIPPAIPEIHERIEPSESEIASGFIDKNLAKKERQELGLPKERSLQEIALENEIKRKEAVAVFLQTKEKRKEKRFSEETYEKQMEANSAIIRRSEKSLSIINRAKILLAKRKITQELKSAGIPDQDKVLRLMTAQDIEYRRNQGEIVESTQTSKAVIAMYQDLYQRVSGKEFKENCQKIGDVYTAVIRINEIGGKLRMKQLIDYYNFNIEQILPLLQELQDLPEEQFRMNLNFLKQYDFLFPPKGYIYDSNDNMKLQPIVDFIGQSQVLTEEQKKAFEIAKRINEITDNPTTETYRSEPFFHHFKASEILPNQERLNDELTVLEQLVLDSYDLEPHMKNFKPDWRQKDLYNDSSSLYRTFDTLTKDNTLHSLAELIRQGFSLSGHIDAYSTSGNTLNLIDDIQKGYVLVKNFDDPQKRSLILLINDLNKAIYPRWGDMALKQCGRFQSIIENQEMSEKSLKTAIEIATRFTSDPKLRAAYVDNFIRQDDETGINLNPLSIYWQAKETKILEKCPPEERLFWQKISDWGNSDADPSFVTPAFLFLNISRFNELYQNNRFTDQFLKEFHEYYQKIGEKSILWLRGDKENFNMRRNRFLLDKENAPPSLIGLAEQIDKLDEQAKATLYQLLGNNYQNWFSLETNGKPNIGFIDMILGQSDVIDGTKIAYQLLTEEKIQDLPVEEQKFWRIYKDINDKNWPSYLSLYLYQNRAKLSDLLIDGSPTPFLIEELAKQGKAFDQLSHFITEKTIKMLPEDEQPYWRFMIDCPEELKDYAYSQRANHVSLFRDGKPTLDFFENTLGEIVENRSSSYSISLLLNRDRAIIASFPDGERRNYWEFFRRCPENLHFFVFNNGLKFGEFLSKDGQPTEAFFMATLRQNPDAALQLLTPERLNSFGPESKIFFSYLQKSTQDLRQYLLSLGKEGFIVKYSNKDSSIKEEELNRDFINETVLRPELIGTWETLINVFRRLGNIDSSTIKANSYLKIAEALAVNTLTQRTEVEALQAVQVAFSSLYREGMTDYEKRAFNLLKRQLPFATDERLREQMRGKALDVEGINQQQLSWVHQTIHNYVRAQNPEYMRTLRDWIKNGDDESKGKLQKLSVLYTPESKPREDFYNESTRQELKEKALPEITNLVNLTEAFFEVNPEKIGMALEELRNRRVLPENMVSEIQSFQQLIVNNSQREKKPQELIAFFIKLPKTRETILKLATEETSERSKSDLLSLDTVLSELYRKGVTEYINLFLERKMGEKTLTLGEATDALRVLGSLIKSGVLEGDIAGNSYEGVMKKIEDTGIAASNYHEFTVLAVAEKFADGQDWRQFSKLAVMEMVRMLERMGYSETDAKNRVIMNDLVGFEKQSFRFTLEPFLDLMLRVEKLVNKLPLSISVDNLYRGEPLIEGSKTDNGIVDQYLLKLNNQFRIPSEINEENQESYYEIIAQVGRLPEMQADKLCKMVVEGYFDKGKGRTQMQVNLGGKKIEFYPFSLYGAKGVIVLIDGKIAENPLKAIENLYRDDIVPAMIRDLREGD